jgi:hypothetical protein
MIKLKDILESIQVEVSLSGEATGDTAWNKYVKNIYDPEKIYTVEKNSVLFGIDYNPIDSVTKGQELNILEPDYFDIKSAGKNKKGKIRSGKYAKVKMIDSGLEGFLTLTSVRKPTDKSSGPLGGKQSKNLTPNNLGLNGKTFNDAASLVSDAKSAVQSKYGDSTFDQIRDYLDDCISTVSTASTLNEAYRRVLNLKNKYPTIHEQDIRIISKNFGEILAAIYILSTNRKASQLKFAPKEDTPFYDFYIKSGDAVKVGDEKMEKGKIFYSVKSKGGSSTAMENLNFLLNNYSKLAFIYNDYKNELEVINSLMNDKLNDVTTISNIEKFFNKHLPEKINSIVSKLNSITNEQNQIKNLSQPELDKWFSFVVNNVDITTFVSTMRRIYSEDLGGSEAKDESLNKMYSTKKSKDNGYLYYAMGSYIVKYLNSYSEGGSYPYVEALNVLLNYGSFVQQFDIDVTYNQIEINIEKFKSKAFRFSYNGVASSPGNRPIGFKG